MDAPIPAQKAPYGVAVGPASAISGAPAVAARDSRFCDGSHKGTGLTPLMYTPEKSGQVWFCGCKATGKAPLCDGTQRRRAESRFLW